MSYVYYNIILRLITLKSFRKTFRRHFEWKAIFLRYSDYNKHKLQFSQKRIRGSYIFKVK